MTSNTSNNKPTIPNKALTTVPHIRIIRFTTNFKNDNNSTR